MTGQSKSARSWSRTSIRPLPPVASLNALALQNTINSARAALRRLSFADCAMTERTTFWTNRLRDALAEQKRRDTPEAA